MQSAEKVKDNEGGIMMDKDKIHCRSTVRTLVRQSIVITLLGPVFQSFVIVVDDVDREWMHLAIISTS